MSSKHHDYWLHTKTSQNYSAIYNERQDFEIQWGRWEIIFKLRVLKGWGIPFSCLVMQLVLQQKCKFDFQQWNPNRLAKCKNIFEMGWLILAVKNFTNYINSIKRRKDVQQKPKSLLLEMSEVTLVSEKMKQKTNHSNNFILKSHFNILRGLLLLPSDVSINYPLHLLKKKSI